MVKFYIKSDDEEVYFLPKNHIDFVPKEKVLGPGELVYGRAKIFYGARGYSFPKVGTYKVRAEYQGLSDHYGRTINSNTVDVIIRPPKNKEEEEQVRLIKGDQQALLFLFEGGEHLTDGINQLTRLAQEYPNSTLGSYANAVLGLHWSRDFADFRNKRVRKADHEKALYIFRNR